MRLLCLEPAPVLVGSGVLSARGVGARCLLEPSPAPGPGARVPCELHEIAGESELRFRRMDRYAALGFAAAQLALAASPCAPDARLAEDWGIALGSSQGCWASNAEFFAELERRPVGELSPALFARTVANSVNGEISIARRIAGTSQTLVSGSSAGAEALVEGALALVERRARFVLAGGVEAPVESLRPELAEGAALCVLARPEDAAAGFLSVRGFARGRDTADGTALVELLRALGPEPPGTLLLADRLPPEIDALLRAAVAPARIVSIPERAGEIGAAGAPAALALASLLEGTRFAVIARGAERGTVVLVLER